MWPNPLQYYLVPDIEVEPEEGDNSDEFADEEQFEEEGKVGNSQSFDISLFRLFVSQTRRLRRRQVNKQKRNQTIGISCQHT